MYVNKLEQVQQKPVRWSGAGAQAPEERLGEQGLLSLTKADFGGPKSAPVPMRKSSRWQSQTLHSGAWWEDNNINANKRGSDEV